MTQAVVIPQSLTYEGLLDFLRRVLRLNVPQPKVHTILHHKRQCACHACYKSRAPKLNGEPIKLAIDSSRESLLTYRRDCKLNTNIGHKFITEGMLTNDELRELAVRTYGLQPTQEPPRAKRKNRDHKRPPRTRKKNVLHQKSVARVL